MLPFCLLISQVTYNVIKPRNIGCTPHSAMFRLLCFWLYQAQTINDYICMVDAIVCACLCLKSSRQNDAKSALLHY